MRAEVFSLLFDWSNLPPFPACFGMNIVRIFAGLPPISATRENAWAGLLKELYQKFHCCYKQPVLHSNYRTVDIFVSNLPHPKNLGVTYNSFRRCIPSASALVMMR